MGDNATQNDRGNAAGAPDTSTQGVDEQVTPDEDSDTVTLQQESRLGPGAGENPVVKVTSPVQHEHDDDVTSHPTFRGHSPRSAPETERRPQE